MATHNWDQLAAQAWEILTQQAARREPLYYSELAGKLGVHWRLMRWPLELIQLQCEQHDGWPPLTILVISKATHQPGAGFRGASPEHYRTAVREVLDFDWSAQANPFGFALDGTSRAELISELLAGPDKAAAVYRLVPDRGSFQRLFRDALFKAYRGRCAFSGSQLEEVLDAAHIVPWSEATSDEVADVRNGLLLNVYYHRLFDRDILHLGEDLVITLAPTVDYKQLSDFDREAVDRVNGRHLQRPTHKQYLPKVEFIRRRYQEEV